MNTVFSARNVLNRKKKKLWYNIFPNRSVYREASALRRCKSEHTVLNMRYLNLHTKSHEHL